MQQYAQMQAVVVNFFGKCMMYDIYLCVTKKKLFFAVSVMIWLKMTEKGIKSTKSLNQKKFKQQSAMVFHVRC